MHVQELNIVNITKMSNLEEVLIRNDTTLKAAFYEGDCAKQEKDEGTMLQEARLT